MLGQEAGVPPSIPFVKTNHPVMDFDWLLVLVSSGFPNQPCYQVLVVKNSPSHWSDGGQKAAPSNNNIGVPTPPLPSDCGQIPATASLLWRPREVGTEIP